jgi:AAA15 family ATPase/GTPase
MKVSKVHIENYKNISFGYIENLPDFVVIGGANGCGKSTFLEAIFNVKEAVAPYRGFPEKLSQNIISANAHEAKVLVELSFSEYDIQYAFDRLDIRCPNSAKLYTKINKSGETITDCPNEVRTLLNKFKIGENVPGFFDYFDAHRRINKRDLNNISLDQSPDDIKRTLSQSEDKYNQNKEYLSTLRIRHLVLAEKSLKKGLETFKSPLDDIQNFFNDFFYPMKLMDISFDSSPIKFNIETPSGVIDIDELSSGEKEIFHSYIRFHRFSPKGAVILFDEPDLHLHPEVIKRYLLQLKKTMQGNQLIITTHSPEIMLGVDSSSLYTIQKGISAEGYSQIYQVISNENRFDLLKDIVGSSGIISFNKKIVFIEGEHSSSDIAVYESFYPSHKFNLKFVPAKNSLGINKTSEKIQDLLSSSVDFQEYYCIVDGDLNIKTNEEPLSERLFRLPVYHIENFLLDEDKIFKSTQKLLRDKNPYKNKEQILEELKTLILSDSHLNPYSRALLESKTQKVISDFQKTICKTRKIFNFNYEIESFDTIKAEAKVSLKTSLDKNEWKDVCIGRELLKAFCRKNNIKYQYLKNLLIDELEKPPEGLNEIFKNILKKEGKLNTAIDTLPKKRDVNIDDQINLNEISILMDETSPFLDDKRQRKLLSGELIFNDYSFKFKEGLCKLNGPNKKILMHMANTLNEPGNYYIYNRLESLFKEELDDHDERKNELIQILGIPGK